MRERERERERDLVRYNLLAFVMTRNSLFGMGVVVESPVIVRAGAVRTYAFVHTHIQGTNIISNQFLFIYSSALEEESVGIEREREENPITSSINEGFLPLSSTSVFCTFTNCGALVVPLSDI